MPILGEIRQGKEIGKKNTWQKYIYHACVDCGKERWTDIIVSTCAPKHLRCNSCSSRINNAGKHTGEKNGGWKGGRFLSGAGYVFIKCPPEFLAMANINGYTQEHRLVMAQSLGRPLQPSEKVHHWNGIKDDNKTENLYLCSSTQEHFNVQAIEIEKLRNRVKELEEKVKQLEKEEE